MPHVSVVVLAGGQSQRLGRDKSLLEIDGEWLLQRILTQLAILSDDVLVVANEQGKLASLPARIVADVHQGMGPLGGIYSGLLAMGNERGLFVACDMPLLNLRLLQYMIQLSPAFDVVIPRIGEETEPLHAVYSKACLHPIAEALERGERRVIYVFDRVRVRYVEREEIETFDPEHLSFFNINTPADVQRARELMRQASWPGLSVGGASGGGGGRPRTLVIGYGNLDRGDDGVAHHVVNKLRQRLGQKVLGEGDTGMEDLGGEADSILLTQLLPGLIDTLADYDQVIFVDAHVIDTADDVQCVLIASECKHAAFTHHMTPEMLLALLKTLYHKRLTAHLVSVRGREFDFRRGLSPDTASLIEPAVDCILRLIGLDEKATMPV